MSILEFDHFAARGSRTPCPDCGLTGTMTLSEEMRTVGVDSDGRINFSLAGVQLKYTAKLFTRITCGAEDVKGCGWSALGEYEGRHFVIKHLKEGGNETPANKA